jgi:hypothetical protein
MRSKRCAISKKKKRKGAFVEGVLVVVLALFTLLLLGTVTLFTRKDAAPVPSKSALQKRSEIIEGYRQRLGETLEPYRDDPDAFRAKKAELLREFSIEISRNIFFGPGEVREVIRDLAHHAEGEA